MAVTKLISRLSEAFAAEPFTHLDAFDSTAVSNIKTGLGEMPTMENLEGMFSRMQDSVVNSVSDLDTGIKCPAY